MSGATKLMTAGGGGVSLTPASSIASDVTVNVPSQNCTLGIQGPAFSAYQNSVTSFTNNTATKVDFQVENFDTNSNFASSKFTPTVAGYYQVNAKIAFSANATNSRWVAIYKNGSKVADIAWTNGDGTNYAEPAGSYLISMNGSTDYIEIYGYQNSGSTLTSDGGGNTYFQASLVRAA